MTAEQTAETRQNPAATDPCRQIETALLGVDSAVPAAVERLAIWRQTWAEWTNREYERSVERAHRRAGPNLPPAADAMAALREGRAEPWPRLVYTRDRDPDPDRDEDRDAMDADAWDDRDRDRRDERVAVVILLKLADPTIGEAARAVPLVAPWVDDPRDPPAAKVTAGILADLDTLSRELPTPRVFVRATTAGRRHDSTRPIDRDRIDAALGRLRDFREGPLRAAILLGNDARPAHPAASTAGETSATHHPEPRATLEFARLCEIYGVAERLRDPLRRRLYRLRVKDPNCCVAIEDTERTSRESKYLWRAGPVRPTIEKFLRDHHSTIEKESGAPTA